MIRVLVLPVFLAAAYGCNNGTEDAATQRPATVPVAAPATPSLPDPVPPYTTNERAHLPVLHAEIAQHWPDVPRRAFLGGQIRKETCAGLKSKKCWSPTAELKTDREYGFGLGQLTVTARFDNFKEAKKLDKSLATWSWDDRYAPEFQIRTLILMDRNAYRSFSWAANDNERMAFALAAYNGGIGGVLSDRTVCKATPNCNNAVWFDNVEHTSKKAKVAASGYGQSFFQINRAYVRDIMLSYADRYHVLDSDFEINFKKVGK